MVTGTSSGCDVESSWCSPPVVAVTKAGGCSVVSSCQNGCRLSEGPVQILGYRGRHFAVRERKATDVPVQNLASKRRPLSLSDILLCAVLSVCILKVQRAEFAPKQTGSPENASGAFQVSSKEDASVSASSGADLAFRPAKKRDRKKYLAAKYEQER